MQAWFQIWLLLTVGKECSCRHDILPAPASLCMLVLSNPVIPGLLFDPVCLLQKITLPLSLRLSPIQRSIMAIPNTYLLHYFSTISTLISVNIVEI